MELPLLALVKTMLESLSFLRSNVVVHRMRSGVNGIVVLWIIVEIGNTAEEDREPQNSVFHVAIV